MSKPMKNIIVLIILCTTTYLLPTQAPYDIYVENYYGSPIVCIVNGRNITINSHIAPVKLLSLPAKKSPSLSIQTNSLLTSSTPLDNKIAEIIKESANNKNKNAVLIVQASSCLSEWDIRLVWYNQHNFVRNFSMETPEEEAQTKERQFQVGTISTQDLLLLIESSNLYGPEYAEKMRLLRSLNYDAVIKKNYHNTPAYVALNTFGYPILLTSIDSMQSDYKYYLSDPDAQRTQRGNRDPQEVQLRIKCAIDTQYTHFLQYKENGWLEETE